MPTLRSRLAKLTPLELFWLALGVLLVPPILVCMVAWPLWLLGFFGRG
jgi:hypothetical protein